MSEIINPNSSILGTATDHNAVNPLDNTIADKMAAMLSQRDNSRNQQSDNQPTATGESEVATDETPVAPDNVENIVEPEGSEEIEASSEGTEESEVPEEVNDAGSDSTSEELIDFLEFTNSNPNAKFKFMRNGKEVIIDAKKAAAILGQGSAIHEEARELKVQRAEFDEYQKERQSHLEGLSLAMEFTIQPKLKDAYDEILKTQGYQTVFQQQLEQATDYAERARIEAAMEQNERYIRSQSELVGDLKPKIDEFKTMRKQQVAEVLETNRKLFKDKELKNSFVFNEVREKVAKDWQGARGQLVPGIDNLDLISSDEHILSLLRDGLKYRDKPKGTSAGASVASLTAKRGSPVVKEQKDQISTLRDQANKGDKKASQNLLEARLAQIRGRR